MSIINTVSKPATAPRAKPLRERLTPNWTVGLAISFIAYLAISWAILNSFPDAEPRFRIDVRPLLTAELALQIHLAAALTTFVTGTILLTGLPKGSRIHKQLGWTWVSTMAITAVSSFFLIGLNGGHFSFIHGLSAWTVISLPMAVAAARRHKVKNHAKQMRGMFFGGMAIAGLFSFLPGRFLWSVFFAA